jgi:peroxiredoxin
MEDIDAKFAITLPLGETGRFLEEVLPVPAHYHPAHVTHPPTPLPAGTLAPDFALPATPDQTISLSDFRGRAVVLAFYPADWSPVCSDQMALYNELLSEFRRFKAQVLGISVDGSWCHLAFAKDRNLHFPLLADFEPKGAVSHAYGAYQGKIGESARALFVIDGAGIIRWSYLSPVGVNPGADGIFAALEAIQNEQPASAT